MRLLQIKSINQANNSEIFNINGQNIITVYTERTEQRKCGRTNPLVSFNTIKSHTSRKGALKTGTGPRRLKVGHNSQNPKRIAKFQPKKRVQSDAPRAHPSIVLQTYTIRQRRTLMIDEEN